MSGIDLGLDRLRRLAEHFPPYTRPTCHIAGTNGKGSVAAFVSGMLLSSTPPLSVGRFNSPHLVSVNDSIVVDGKPVSMSLYKQVREEVESMNRSHDIGATSFELLTLTALLIFERTPVDVVVLEVGLGGRLDATNVVADECILVSALTAVDLDHQAFLGSTVEAIAREKAAIARAGKPFVLGSQAHPEVEKVVNEVVSAVDAPLVYPLPVLDRDWDENIDGPAPAPLSASLLTSPPATPVRFSMPCFDHPVLALLPLHGEHQLDNLALAVSIVSAALMSSTWTAIRPRFTEKSIAEGIKSVQWPGRLSFHRLESPPLRIMADGAHNPASSATLAAYLSALFRGSNERLTITFILGLSHSPPKTPRETLAPLFPFPEAENLKVDWRVALVEFTAVDGMPWVKPVPPAVLREVVRDLVPGAETWIDESDPPGSLHRALKWAADNDSQGLVVIAGSLYLVADFYRLHNVPSE